MDKTNSTLDCSVLWLKNFYHDNIFYPMLIRREESATRARLKAIGGGYHGSSKEYRDIVLRFWNKYRLHPNQCWYDLYCANRDCYDPKYIPNPIWLAYVLRHFNWKTVRLAYADKAMYSRLLPHVKKPETVVKRIKDIYYNGDDDIPISIEEAKKLVLQEEHLIFKPSMDSYGGQGIEFFDRQSAEKVDLDLLFKEYQFGFVAQRLVKQHPTLAAINKDSVNTIRVITFRFHGKVHVLSTVLRMGTAGARVDNTTAGGCACPIKPDGWLAEKAVNRKSEWIDRHQSSGILFKDIHVPNFDSVIDTAISTHKLLPYFDLIGWDFSVDQDGTPILIEYNLMPEQNQISCGPTFGDMTEEVLDEVFRDRLK